MDERRVFASFRDLDEFQSLETLSNIALRFTQTASSRIAEESDGAQSAIHVPSAFVLGSPISACDGPPTAFCRFFRISYSAAIKLRSRDSLDSDPRATTKSDCESSPFGDDSTLNQESAKRMRRFLRSSGEGSRSGLFLASLIFASTSL